MIWQGFSTCRDPIGLDIGRRYVKAAQMSGPRLTAAVSIPRAGDGAALETGEIRQVAEVLRGRPFRGRSVVVAVPPDKLMTSILELPPRSSGAPLERLARMELARCHQVDAEAVEMACWDMPSPVAARAANRTYVMTVACRHADADALVDSLEAEGLLVRAMDVHALAIARACRDASGPAGSSAGDTAAILDVGWASSRLVLLYQGTVVYERNLTRCGVGKLAGLFGDGPDGVQATPAPPVGEATTGPGGAAVTPRQPPASDRGRAQLDAIAGEISTPLSYLANQYPNAVTRQLLLVGGGAAGAAVPGLAEFLSHKLNVQVRAVEPSELCSSDGSVDPLGPSMALAIGLARYTGDGR